MNSITGSKILVIGGAGFIGSNLIDRLLLEDVKEIIIYDNFTRGSHENINAAIKDPRVKIFDLGGDILHTDILNEAINGSDYVFHLAALWLLHCYDYPRSAFRVNIEGTYNVIEACVKNNIKKLIYSSSASVYGNALETPMTENHKFNNDTFYGATKIAGEQMLKAFHKRYGLDYVGLRYMNVYGERADYLSTYTTIIMKILDRIDENKSPIIYGDGSQSYDFVHVSDVARANILALKSSATNDFYNVGTGIGTSIKKIAEILLDITKSDLNLEYSTNDKTFVTNRIGSIDKAEKDIDFKYSVDLVDGLKDLVKWRKLNKEI